MMKRVASSKAFEASNVEAIEEMIGMISAQRAYEMSSKVISSADQMLQNWATFARRYHATFRFTFNLFLSWARGHLAYGRPC